MTEEEDPVEMMKKLRKWRLSKGIKGTAKAVKGASRTVVKGTKKMARTTQRTVRFGGGRTAAQDISKTLNKNYDVETATTERDPLLDASLDGVEKAPSRRSGAALWTILRNGRDDVIFMNQDDSDQEHDNESVSMRKTRRQKKIVDEFRNAIEFSLTHCLFAILVYLIIAVLAYSLVFEHFTIIDRYVMGKHTCHFHSFD